MRITRGKALKLIFLGALFLIGYTAVSIYTFGSKASHSDADAAVVLGAAVWSNQVSPVFRERINHAVQLYRAHRVGKIVFTGGQGNPNEPTEAAAARAYAIQNGVPAGDILIEQTSHTTYQNVVNAKQLVDANGLRTVLIVSDPMHMKRALTMAQNIGLEAYPSPTPTTLYTSWRSQFGELSRETVYYLGYRVSSLIGQPK